MATHAVATNEVGCYEKMLSANSVDTVVIAGSYPAVEVVSNGASAVYVTVDETDPTVAGQHCFMLPAGAPSVRQIRTPRNADTVVKLIASGAPVYSVARLLE